MFSLDRLLDSFHKRAATEGIVMFGDDSSVPVLGNQDVLSRSRVGRSACVKHCLTCLIRHTCEAVVMATKNLVNSFLCDLDVGYKECALWVKHCAGQSWTPSWSEIQGACIILGHTCCCFLYLWDELSCLRCCRLICLIGACSFSQFVWVQPV